MVAFLKTGVISGSPIFRHSAATECGVDIKV